MLVDPLTTAVAGIAGLGILGGTSLSRRGGEKKGFVHDIKNALTATAVSSERPIDYTTIESALKDEIKKKDKTAGQKAIGMIKTGHILGSLWLLASALPFALKKFFDFDSDSTIFKLFKIHLPFGILGGIGSFLTATFCKNDYENSMVNVMDEHVTRYQIKKDGSAVNLKENAPHSKKFPSLEDVVLPENPINFRREIETELKEAKFRGAIFNFRGITGCGKTMTAQALARGIMNQDYYNGESIQIWDASKNVMDKTMFDYPEGRMIKSFLEYIGIKINTESRTERLERLVANAVAHHRKTGEYVVIVMDEAHALLGMTDAKGSNTADPFALDPTAHAIGDLFDKKIKNQMSKGVVLALTSNVAAKQMGAFMKRRVKDFEFRRPDLDARKETVKLYLGKELAKNDNPKLYADNQQGFIKFTESDYDELAGLGDANLFSDVFHGNKEEAEGAGFLGHISDLENRSMLHYQDVEDAVRYGAMNYKQGGTQELKKLITENLKGRVTHYVKNERDSWTDEIFQYSSSTGTDRKADITRSNS